MKERRQNEDYACGRHYAIRNNSNGIYQQQIKFRFFMEVQKEVFVTRIKKYITEI